MNVSNVIVMRTHALMKQQLESSIAPRDQRGEGMLAVIVAQVATVGILAEEFTIAAACEMSAWLIRTLEGVLLTHHDASLATLTPLVLTALADAAQQL